MTELSIVAYKATTMDLGNEILKSFNNISLLSFPVSILDVMCALLWLLLYSSLVNITYFTSSKLRYHYLPTQSLCHAVLTLVDKAYYPAGHHALLCHFWVKLLPCYCLCIALYTSLRWLVFCHICYTFFHIQLIVSWFVLHNSIYSFLLAFFLLCFTLSCFFISSDRVKFLGYIVQHPFFMLFGPPTFWVYINTYSYVVSLIFSNADASFNISLIMPLSFFPLIDWCS